MEMHIVRLSEIYGRSGASTKRWAIWSVDQTELIISKTWKLFEYPLAETEHYHKSISEIEQFVWNEKRSGLQTLFFRDG
uniref:Uncharacterized protein n=1 Tax=Parascaris equorum TaxID=6256 RepID=A0A914R8X4_PAREQ